MGDTPDVDLTYVSHRYERSRCDDGRRCHRWFLVDQFGAEHLAVVGIETDTMDGHYTYQALEPFASRMPLTCGNQSGVVKWLREWLAGQAGADEGDTFSTHSGGAASSAGTGGPGSGRRKAFASSLCSSRAAILSAAGTSPVSHYVASGGSGRGKKKGGGNQQAMAYSTAPGGKQRAVGIVQQNQIKKARKFQEDIRAEHERLVAGHLTRLRRAAAAEQQADTAAKQVTMSWLQGGLSGEELDALEHWRSLLATVLDLQDQQRQQQQQQQQEPTAVADGSSAQQQQQQPQAEPQQQPQPGKQKKAGGGSSSLVPAGPLPEKLHAWLQQPDSRRHYLRVTLECLRELAAAEIPARMLLQHQLIPLVQRCKCDHQHTAVRSLAETTLTRWRWQLAGHMQVLHEPAYMEDHVGVLEEEHAAGQVPLPSLPKYKQAVLDTPLPTLPGPGNRGAYTPAHSNHQLLPAHHLAHLTHTASAPQLYGGAAAGGYAGLAGVQGHFPGFGGEGFDAVAAAGGYGGLTPAHAAYYTPMASLSDVQFAGASPLSGTTAQLPGQQGSVFDQGGMLAQMGPLLHMQQQQLLAAGAELTPAGAAGVAAMMPGAQAGLAAMPQGWQQAVTGAVAAPVNAPAGGGLAAGSMQAVDGGAKAAAGGVLGQQQVGGALAVQQQTG